jgi:signal peptidase I
MKQTLIYIGKEIWELVKFLAPIVIIVFFVRTFIAQPFIVDGESMAPNFHSGHYLIIDQISYRFKEPARGDVVVLRYPVQPNRFFLKRIIGLPGETINLRDGSVVITNEEFPNGMIIDEPYHNQKTLPAGTYGNITLGQDEFYVMGDNRIGSSDSRSWGVLPRENITGRALIRLFPFNKIDITPASVDDFE